MIRIPSYNGQPDTLQASFGGYPTSVMYDVEHDAFLTENDLNEVDPTYFSHRKPVVTWCAPVAPGAR